MDKVTETRERRLAGIRERAQEAFKCDMCAGSGQVIFYERNFGPCNRCKDVGYDEEFVEKTVAFAESESERVLLEAAKVMCEHCNGEEIFGLAVRPAEFLSSRRWIHRTIRDDISANCAAGPIHNLRSRGESR